VHPFFDCSYPVLTREVGTRTDTLASRAQCWVALDSTFPGFSPASLKCWWDQLFTVVVTGTYSQVNVHSDFLIFRYLVRSNVTNVWQLVYKSLYYHFSADITVYVLTIITGTQHKRCQLWKQYFQVQGITEICVNGRGLVSTLTSYPLGKLLSAMITRSRYLLVLGSGLIQAITIVAISLFCRSVWTVRGMIVFKYRPCPDSVIQKKLVL